MLSIFILFSPDRQKQLDMTISCLKDMKYYDKCQKTIIIDGKPNNLIPDFEIIRVPRINQKYSWANAWNAGVFSAKNENILYLDSDRLLTNNYLERVLYNIKDNTFGFTSYHFMVIRDINLADCKAFLNVENPDFLDERWAGKLRYEPRAKDPVYNGKNVFSGNTAFTKTTYKKLGVDPNFLGHGAYADNDLHLRAAQKGCQFIDLQLPELHYHHKKLENGIELTDLDLQRLSLDNFIYFLHKHKLTLTLAEELAYKCRILNPNKYIKEKIAAMPHS